MQPFEHMVDSLAVRRNLGSRLRRELEHSLHMHVVVSAVTALDMVSQEDFALVLNIELGLAGEVRSHYEVETEPWAALVLRILFRLVLGVVLGKDFDVDHSADPHNHPVEVARPLAAQVLDKVFHFYIVLALDMALGRLQVRELHIHAGENADGSAVVAPCMEPHCHTVVGLGNLEDAHYRMDLHTGRCLARREDRCKLDPYSQRGKVQELRTLPGAVSVEHHDEVV